MCFLWKAEEYSTVCVDHVLLSIRLLMDTWESLYFFKPTIWKPSLSQEVASGWDIVPQVWLSVPTPRAAMTWSPLWGTT